MRSILIFLIPGLLFGAAPSPAERAIQQAEAAIRQSSDTPDGYVSLSFALSRRARETSDAKLYDQALSAAAKALLLSSTNIGAAQARTWALLGKHEFRQALELARKLNQSVPDDVQVYGFITDACVELGLYGEAEKAAQTMLDLRPGNLAALTRGAYLREIFGDLDGAAEWMRQAFARTRPEETEDRAWILTQIGHLLMEKGEVAAAERTLEQALRIFPDYHYALGQLANVKSQQGLHDAAVSLLRKRYDRAPHAENLFELAVELERSGHAGDAAAVFARFEESARAEMSIADNSNRELIYYYADYAGKPEEAVRLAEREMANRQDVQTLSAYAWALFRSGRVAEANVQMTKALAVGTKNRAVLKHAEEIQSGQAKPPARASSLS